ncbi:MAG: (Fe-S)-binding protein [Candidatus Helarchaeota archaeon]|nr:(Fe-S)-binding protein [Candidatus Helarchaeota archaeon]
MDPQPEIEMDIDFKNYKKPKARTLCPTKEVDPDHFMEPDLAALLYLVQFLFKPDRKKFLEVFNCVHCNACKTSNSRYYLKRKLHNARFVSRSTEGMLESYRKYDTPFNQSKYRFKIPEEVPKDSDTLFYMGCLSTIKIPRYTLNAIKYLLSKEIDFTVLDQEACCGIPLVDSGETEMLEALMEKNVATFNSGYKKVVCLCPACFELFNHFCTGIKPEVVYITDYLEPLKKKRRVTLSIQHLCQLLYRGFDQVIPKVEQILIDSGYKIMKNEKHWCCGGGMGIMHIEKTIEKIARIRVNDFKGELLTTYCSSCYHILKLFTRKEKIKPKLVDIFTLLTE